VNVLMNDREDMRTITVSDAYGRIVKQYNNWNGNTLQLNQLQTGAYIIRVKNQGDGSTSTAKFIITGRD